MIPGVQTTNSPSPTLVFAHFAGAGGFLLLAGVAAFAGASDLAAFYDKPHLLAITHLLVLGWINLCAFGVLLQLVPVVFYAPLRWPRLAWGHLVIYVAGASGLVAAFWIGRFDAPLIAAAAVVWLGIALLVFNLGATLVGSGKRDITSWLIAGALVNLLLTATVGLLLAVNFTHPFLPASHLEFLELHAHLGFAGWLLCLIMGAGRRLLPMFLVAPEPPPRRAALAFVAVESGLVLWGAGLWLAPHAAWIVPAAIALLVLGLALWLIEAATIVRTRSRRALDPALKTAVVALGLLAVAAAAGVAVARSAGLASPAVQAYGALFLLGAVSLLIQAFLYKIIPFLVWLHRWSGLVGRQPVPNLRGIAGVAWMRTQLAIFAAGVALLVAGMFVSSTPLLRGGAALLLLSAALLLVNGLRMVLVTPARPEAAPALARIQPSSLS